MSDLISRSELLKEIEKYKFGAISNDAEREYIKKTILDFIICQPTAYSVDGVVEELESFAKLAEDRWTNGTSKHAYQEHKCWVKAIEIVKQGSVGTETETIRDKAVKWNNHSTKKVPYEFIEFVEGKCTIDAEDDVCEWKQTSTARYKTSCGYKLEEYFDTKACYCKQCGKKIKVVE